MAGPQSPRIAVLVAVVLAVIGVGLVASGVVMVFAGDAPEPSATTGPATTVTATAPPGSTAAPATTVTTVDPLAIEFVTLVDDTATITYEAPATWTDVDTGAWTSDGADIGPSLSAAVDLAAWIEGWETPGMFVGVTDRLSAAEALGDFSGSCRLDRTESVTIAGAPGTAQWWWWCDDLPASFYVAVVTLDDDRILLFQILASPEALPVVVGRVLGSFRYTG